MAISGVGSYFSRVASSHGPSSLGGLFDPNFAKPTAGRSGGESIVDQLDLSSEAQAAADAQPIMYKHPPVRADGAVHLTDMQAATKQQLADFNQRMQSILKELGVDPSTEVRLEMDSQGKVRVAGDHSQKEAIEAAIAENPELRNQFAFITSSLRLMQAAEEAAAFQKAYAEDPQAAITQFSHLFDSAAKKPPIGLILSGGSVVSDPPLLTGGN